MAKMITQSLKFVDIVVNVDDTRMLVLCADCSAEMMIRLIITATSVNNPDLQTINHNLMCPLCKGISYLSLRSQK